MCSSSGDLEAGEVGVKSAEQKPDSPGKSSSEALRTSPGFPLLGPGFCQVHQFPGIRPLREEFPLILHRKDLMLKLQAA